jgi:allantoinase
MDLGRPRDPISWPGGARICLSVAVAFESFKNACTYRHGPGGPVTKPDYFSLSYAEYGLKTGVWRLLDLLEAEKVKASFSMSGRAAEFYPKTARAISEAGHEITAHGYIQDVRVEDHLESQTEEIRRTVDAIHAATGQRPVGWSSPGSMGDHNTLIAQHAVGGMTWNGDDASDDVPFIREVDGTRYAILPRNNFCANDLILWSKPTNPPSIIFESFKDTFDQLYQEGCAGSPKWIDIVMHCHMAGRATLTSTMKKVFAYARQHEGVWYAQRREIADWFLKS